MICLHLNGFHWRECIFPKWLFVTINKMKALIALTRLIVNCGKKNLAVSLLCFRTSFKLQAIASELG